jgi:hypothetical protein
MASDHASVAPSGVPRRRAKVAVQPEPLKRYLVINKTNNDGDVSLPNGGRGRLMATFHTPDLAFALAQSERARGRKVVVIDSRVLRSKAGCCW